MRRRIVLIITSCIVLLIIGATLFITFKPITTHTSKPTAHTFTPVPSTFFATAKEEAYSTYQLPGDGDLWPSCWSNDDNMYTANGDGSAFSPDQDRSDMPVSRISGMLPNLTGTTLATDVGTNWIGAGYNRKPTGMLCVNNTIYLAFQNLAIGTFDSVPAASIAKSVDHGATWTWDLKTPMFSNSLFTTVFFLDFGKNYAHSIDNYVYAYGLDNNWRFQQKLYLARVPRDSIQSIASWQFYHADTHGAPAWGTMSQRTPVLQDDRTFYAKNFCDGDPSLCPSLGISQGGVTYDAPLKRYIFSSWTSTTQEFYEAPAPWGPWKLFLSQDFGNLRLSHNRGQYGISIPSKFISADGKTLHVQSNVCCGGDSYTFALRKLYVQPYTPTTATNAKDNTNNLAQTGNETTAISKSTHYGTLCGLDCSDSLNDGNLTGSEDDYDEEYKTTDWWGYTWNQQYTMNKVTYTTGAMLPDGGWYASNLHVQVRQNFQWVDVTGLSTTPNYPYNTSVGAHTTYTFTFKAMQGDGIRIIGTPGGTHDFTSIAELGVYYGA